MAGWNTGRPIYDRLPAESEAYQGNPVVEAITRPFDELLMSWRGILLDFDKDFLNPDTAREDALDWLAQLCGFTDSYWDPGWTPAQKRELIRRSHSFIWPNKGSLILLEYLLGVFGIETEIYLTGQFLVGVTEVGGRLGGELLRYWIRLPVRYRNPGPEWALVERINRLYMPCAAESYVCYSRFYVGLSKVGDPVF
jgi:hypothetical protein